MRPLDDREKAMVHAGAFALYREFNRDRSSAWEVILPERGSIADRWERLKPAIRERWHAEAEACLRAVGAIGR